MKIAHFSYSDKVGADGSAYNLHTALRECGIESTFFVRCKTRNDSSVIEIKYSHSEKERIFRTIEMLYCKQNVVNDSLVCSLDIVGFDIDDSWKLLLSEFDVIHLHWVTGLLSVDNIKVLISIGKPIVWTMHDFHPMTGICHSPLGCSEFKHECKECKQLKENDLGISYEMWKGKREYGSKIYPIVSCRWLGEELQSSSIFGSAEYDIIPVGINTNEFIIKDKWRARQKFGFAENDKIVLIGAQALGTYLKGQHNLGEIFKYLGEYKQVKLVAFGANSDKLKNVGVPVVSMGFISDRKELCDLYNAADVFLFTSMQDTFGMTATEAMACGTPVVAYNLCAMRDVIRNGVNGYKATWQNYAEVAEYIKKCFDNNTFDREKCRNVVVREYSLFAQTYKTIELYKRLVVAKGLELGKDMDGSTIENDFFVKTCIKQIVCGEAMNQDKTLSLKTILAPYNLAFLSPEEKINKLIRENKLDRKIYIYGCGEFGRRTLIALEKNGFLIEGFFDSDDEKIGMKIGENDIFKITNKASNWKGVILISCNAYYSVADKLIQLGYIEGYDFF